MTKVSTKLIDQAKGTLDKEILTETGSGGFFSAGYFHDQPLYEYLQADEHPHYLLYNSRKGLKIQGGRGSTKSVITSDRGYRAAALVTNYRIIFLVGQKDGDQFREVDISEVTNVEGTTGWFANRLTIKSGNVAYLFGTKRGDETEQAANYIEAQLCQTRGATNEQAVSTVEDKPGDNSATKEGQGNTTKRSEDNLDYSEPESNESSPKWQLELAKEFTKGSKVWKPVQNGRKMELSMMFDTTVRAHYHYSRALELFQKHNTSQVDHDSRSISEAQITTTLEVVEEHLDQLLEVKKKRQNATKLYEEGHDRYDSGANDAAIGYLVQAISLYKETLDTGQDLNIAFQDLQDQLESAVALFTQLIPSDATLPPEIELEGNRT